MLLSIALLGCAAHPDLPDVDATRDHEIERARLELAWQLAERAERLDADSCVKDMKLALDLAPEDFQTRMTAARLFRKAHHVETNEFVDLFVLHEAVVHVDRALEAQPDHLEALLLRAELQVDRKNFKEAVKDYERLDELLKREERWPFEDLKPDAFQMQVDEARRGLIEHPKSARESFRIHITGKPSEETLHVSFEASADGALVIRRPRLGVASLGISMGLRTHGVDLEPGEDMIDLEVDRGRLLWVNLPVHEQDGFISERPSSGMRNVTDGMEIPYSDLLQKNALSSPGIELLLGLY